MLKAFGACALRQGKPFRQCYELLLLLWNTIFHVIIFNKICQHGFLFEHKIPIGNLKNVFIDEYSLYSIWCFGLNLICQWPCSRQCNVLSCILYPLQSVTCLRFEPASPRIEKWLGHSQRLTFKSTGSGCWAHQGFYDPKRFKSVVNTVSHLAECRW